VVLAVAACIPSNLGVLFTGTTGIAGRVVV
jgi:hypothetical protein